LFWRELLRNVLPSGSVGIMVVVGNDCNQSFSYRINGPTPVYMGFGDLHEVAYDKMGVYSTFKQTDSNVSGTKTYSGIRLNEDFCPYWIKAYPSKSMEDLYTTNSPMIFTIAIVFIFLFTTVTFLVYDFLVERRQQKVMRAAVQTSAIVSSLFPSVIRDRLFAAEAELPTKKDKQGGFHTPKLLMQTFLRDDGASRTIASSVEDRPIAELFTAATVMFADISGFTAWSSMREPAQVFTLLETIYGAFDAIAKRRGVFKVETIGDSYVAVAGLPEPRPDHAVVMVRFARDCRNVMNELTKQLEITLGPDTCELQLRFGLNSGPVTAGVLRGEKSRFQLFGDTVNTASRMESTSERNKIQVSQATAELLIAAGKQHWVTARSELVKAKGKGSLQTFWADPVSTSQAGGNRSKNTSSAGSSNNGPDENAAAQLNKKLVRLVGWNTDVLCRLLRQVIAKRESQSQKQRHAIVDVHKDQERVAAQIASKGGILAEIVDVLELPDSNSSKLQNNYNATDVDLSTAVVDQVREYVTAVAMMYHDVPFHNFEHASHVTMSVSKFLSRIVLPEASTAQDSKESEHGDQTKVDYPYAITSDPLTQFAVVFSSLIHDIDHPGVPNLQVVKENMSLASVYKGKSVLEQNSIDLSWCLFMDNKFDDFRMALCASPGQLTQFRQLVVNCVMSTDILDREVLQMREKRWDLAFDETRQVEEPDLVRINRKATLVLEYLMQASDVAHTMQHWHIYRKWNERLFEEMYAAYRSGRAEKNPLEFWYEGEIGFFKFYVIPLANKLSECGVFGASSDECLNYAKKNLEEWEARGQEVVYSMAQNAARRSLESMSPSAAPSTESTVC
jgi:class 3 adenylate cyclase